MSQPKLKVTFSDFTVASLDEEGKLYSVKCTLKVQHEGKCKTINFAEFIVKKLGFHFMRLQASIDLSEDTRSHVNALIKAGFSSVLIDKIEAFKPIINTKAEKFILGI